MTCEPIVLGLLDTSQAIGDPAAAERFRSLTIAWSRYGYGELIIERDSVDAIVSAAAEAGFRYCLILAYGCVIYECWAAEDTSHQHDFFALLREWVAANEFYLAGTGIHLDAGHQLQPHCLLVDLEQHCRLGAPSLTAGGEAVARQVQPLDDALARHILDLQPTEPDHRDALTPWFGEGIQQYDADSRQGSLDRDQRLFMETVKNQATNARRGVFLWNIESYADVETPRSDFQTPVSTLYSVAAGFKPNRILQTHGFADNSRVVYFDYSPRALEIRKTLVEQWDGEDFPQFVKHLFETFPHPQTFYQLWDNLTPEEVAWEDIEALWQRELDRWGGPQAWQQHWRRYQQLEHEYVCCDLLSDTATLMSRIVDEPSAIIWWSNAFFTMYGNWLYPIDHRRQAYEDWIEQLARRSPQLYLFGSDFNNSNVNFIKAEEYLREYRRSSGDYLNPPRIHQVGIRM